MIGAAMSYRKRTVNFCMLPLRAETRQLIDRLERLSDREIQMMGVDDLPLLASLQIARDGASFHVLRYKPSSDPLDYVVAHQVGFVLRMFELPAEQRMDFAGTGHGVTDLEEVIRLTSGSSTADQHVLPEFAKFVHQWALMQLRSIPIGMRVDAWLHSSFPALRELVAQGIGVQQQMNADILGRRVGNLTPPPIHLAPAAAYALFADRLLATNLFAIPFEAVGAVADGKTLLNLFDAIPDDPPHDRQLVDAWAERLGMTGWYEWVHYQP